MEMRSATLRKIMSKEHKQTMRKERAKDKEDRIVKLITERTILEYLIDHGPTTNTELSTKLVGGPVCNFTLMRTDDLLRRLMASGFVSYANYVYKAEKPK